MHICAQTPKESKKVSDSLELELKMTVSTMQELVIKPVYLICATLSLKKRN